MTVAALDVCPSCAYPNKCHGESCNLCGEMLVEPIAFSLPEPRATLDSSHEQLLRDVDEEREVERRSFHSQFLRRRMEHALAGALTYIALIVAFGFMTQGLKFFGDIWGWTRAILLGSLTGAPAGYVVSLVSGGPLIGATISGLVFGSIQFLSFGIFSGDWAFNNFSYSFLVGLLPGLIIGFHVRAD